MPVEDSTQALSRETIGVKKKVYSWIRIGVLWVGNKERRPEHNLVC